MCCRVKYCSLFWLLMLRQLHTLCYSQILCTALESHQQNLSKWIWICCFIYGRSQFFSVICEIVYLLFWCKINLLQTFVFFICFTWQVVVRLLSLNLKLNIVAVCFFSVFILFMYHVFFTVLALHNRFLILCWPFSQYPFILFGTLCYCTTLCCLIN